MENKISLNSFVSLLARKKIKTRDDFLIILKQLNRKYQLPTPSHAEIIASYKILLSQHKIRQNKFFEEKLKKRPMRSLSGVTVVSVLTKPYPCPGHCLYCPTDKNFPKSYLPGEPAADRAKSLKYDPYHQVKYRLETLQKIGHSTDKIELIVIGGSFNAYLPNYQAWFIKRCFEGANSCNTKHTLHSKSLGEAQKQNETAKNRIISLSIETRPDLITLEEIKRMRELGVTKVELGIQALDDKVLKQNKRGHGIKEIIMATKLLKDSGLKVCYHIMPGLYGSNPKKDLAIFKKMFTDQNFQPDYLKIYPCVVVKGSQLYKFWKNKKYQPYTNKTLIDLLIKMKRVVPPYVRIIRVFRDIPSNKIEAGSKISNLREVVQREMTKRGTKCQCIRCCEIKNTEFEIKNIKLIKREYKASNGKENFLSFEDTKQNKILAFLRLRLPELNATGCVLPVLEDAAIIRELHTYGEIVKIGKKKKSASQHKNLGKKLVEEAEKITRKSGFNKIVVISGIGARPYWQKLGYKLQETYMIKNI
jgi:elongator complex protein 3